MDADKLESTNRLLRVIIALLLRGNGEQAPKLREQIKFLDEVGIGPTEIGKIIGRPVGYVTKELAGLRKTPKGKRK
jgi:hypothetical protein